MLLRRFLFAFAGPAELRAALDALVLEVGVHMVAVIGVEGLPFIEPSMPMLKAFGLGISRL